MGSKHKDAGYMKVVALEDGLTVSFSKPLEYSFDEIVWQSLPANTGTPAINKDQYVAFRANNLTPNSSSGIGTFSIDKQCDLKGNCMSLLFGDDFSDKVDLTGYDYAFYKLFYNQSNIKSVDTGFLPATTLRGYCYMEMFYGCTSLTTSPELPATTLANCCYWSMFQGCTSLTTAPELPATTLASSCYYNMFYSCTSLTTAPELTATTLASGCYYYMFYGCTSLTTAPGLPATTLAEYCYYNMFSRCTSLTTAPELPATTLANYCYQNMFNGCTSLTTAPIILPATTLANKCYQKMFSGCTSLTTAPELHATTLANNCCLEMFSRCTSLTTAPTILPSTTLAISCYSSMFMDCTNLTTAPELPATTLANSCYSQMFLNCKSLTIAPELPATTLASDCYKSMFNGCTSLTTAPELPATALASNCYVNMFNNCTNLTTAPIILPATTLDNDCYNSMFRDCTSLTTAPELPATTLASNCYEDMFTNCKSLTTAPELPATTLINGCYRHMFFGCTNLNYIKALFTTIPDLSYTESWVWDVSSTGTFVKSKDATWDVTGQYGVPTGWTVLKGDPDYMKVVALEDDLTVSFTNPLEYSLDGTTWQSLPANTQTPAINKDQYVAFRAKLTPNSSSGIGTFSIDKQCDLKGNCMSLLFGNNFVDKVDLTGYNYAFCKLFYNQKTIKSVNPGFLPATTLARNCYNSMFYGCTSLTKAPELPATTLVDYCYQYMFNGCTNLNYIKALFTTTPDYSYTSNWVNGVSSTGTFVKSKDATWGVTGYNGVPNGWTVEIAIDYEFIDLGLPSGTKWSTRNLGALDVNDVGLYYQNGGEQGYKVVLEPGRGSYDIVSSEPAGFDFSTYNISEFKDAANIIDKDMSIPSVEDWDELVNNGTFTEDGTNTVYTSNINGNTIIFPQNLILEDGYGLLEKSPFCAINFSIHATNAFCICDNDCMGCITESVDDLASLKIQSGMPIRPVKKVG